jgi:hypothetical protein
VNRYPRVRWSWPLRVLATVAALAIVALFVYSMGAV